MLILPASLAFFSLAATVVACAQSCPRENPSGPSFGSAPRTLSGTVIYHDEIRKWTELHLAAPVCGTNSVQLLDGVGGAFEVDEGASRQFEVLRGCAVTLQGTLGIPGTGYYSANLYLNTTRITPAADCVKKPPFPDYSGRKPGRFISRYRVEMRLNYSERGGPIFFKVTSRGSSLLPWQAYASYALTGGYVLYAQCAEGFTVGSVFGTPEARPGHFDESGTAEDRAMFDPESAAAKHITKLTLGYTCRRDQ